ncbi:MAG: hypothetical protein Ta2F_07400 [Termitinemataceae bacterium]|nr:MAG: hypothetical protein Ta2F_07400 [Termitinemataceae bacterium]
MGYRHYADKICFSVRRFYEHKENLHKCRKSGGGVNVPRYSKPSKTFFSLFATAIVACILGAGCGGGDGSGAEISSGGGGSSHGGTTTKGVYAIFSTEGGRFADGKATVTKNLVYVTVPNVVFNAKYAGETAFLTANDLTEYDYVANPNNFGEEEFTIDGNNYLYTVESPETIDSPTWINNNQSFAKWQIKTGVDSKLTGLVTAGTDVNPVTFKFTIPGSDGILTAKTSGSYVTFKAVYVMSDELQTAGEDLEHEIVELTSGSDTDTYVDEYLVGSGLLDGENDLIAQRRAELVAAITEANALIAGHLQQVDIETEALQTDDEGNIITGPDDEPLHVIEHVSYVTYDAAAINNALVRLREMKESGNYAFDNFVPREATIPAMKSENDYHSVTIATTGNYEIELYGASGGHLWSTNNRTALGGKGGHVKGIVALNAGDVLKFHVGSAGAGTAAYDAGSGEFAKLYTAAADIQGAKAGGFNGGGGGGAGVTNSSSLIVSSGSGGGGATDVRKIGSYNKGVNTGQTTPGAADKRIMVAGGGGGAAQSAGVSIGGGAQTWPGIRGGNAGESGIIRNAVKSQAAKPDDYMYFFTSGTATVWYGTYNTNETAGTADGVGETGITGVIANGNGWEGRGGGGGGYVGGAAHTVNALVDYTASGGGGSNYVGTGTSSPIDELSDYYGDGKASIKFVN